MKNKDKYKSKIVAKVVVLLLFATFRVQGQDGMAERLLQMEQEVATGNLSDEEMFANYRLLIHHNSTRDFDKSKMYFQKGIDFARAKKRVEWEAQFWGMIGQKYREWGENDSVLVCYNRAMKLIESKDFYMLETQIQGAIGDFYAYINQHQNALNAYHQALEIIEKDKNKQLALKQDVTEHHLRQAYTIIDMGVVYLDLLNFEKSVEYHLRAKQILDENPHEDNPVYEIIIFVNLAESYVKMGQTDKVLPLALRAYELSVELEYLEYQVYALRLLSDYYRAEKNLKQALHYAKEALQIAQETGQPYLLNRADEVMMDTSREMKDYQTALFHAGRIAERTPDDDWDTLQRLYKGLILIYSSMNNPSKTEEYLNKLSDVTSKISDTNLHNSLQEMEVKYNVQKIELENTRQRAEIERHRIIRNMGLAVFLLIVGFLTIIVILHKKRNRALVETNTMKDKFFSIISHDLKNPAFAQRDGLKALMDYANKTEKIDTNLLSNSLSRLHHTATGMVELLKNLLNWAQLQTGRDIYKPAPFNLVSKIQPDMGVIRNMAERKNITFDAQIPQKAIITADENMLTAIVRNLLSNAVKFTKEGGKVSLEITERGGKTVVTVSDTGIGMTAEQKQNLFRIDRQQSTQDTTGEQGTGLGLIVCREFLEQHGTTLNVESEKGKGSRFWFEVKG